MARLAALGRVHSDGGRRRPVASAGNSIPVSAPNPKSRSVTYCSSGVSRAANFAMAMLLETRMASASVSEGWGSSSVIVRPGTRHLPPSPDTWSVGDTRRSASRAAAAKIFARDPGSNVSVNALGRALPSRWREARASTSPVPGSSVTTSPPSAPTPGGGRRGRRSARPSAFTDTFEPGSLAKIFAAAALLSLRRVSPTDHVSGERGKWRVPGRTITDDDPQPSLTLADAIRVSSNIAIAKFAARLTPEEQYVTLRDFGFGALTGIEFPAEATGRLRPPSEWTRPSAASLAMGYELSVTPIQVAKIGR